MRVERIELSAFDWKSKMLPLHHTRLHLPSQPQYTLLERLRPFKRRLNHFTKNSPRETIVSFGEPGRKLLTRLSTYHDSPCDLHDRLQSSYSGYKSTVPSFLFQCVVPTNILWGVRKGHYFKNTRRVNNRLFGPRRGAVVSFISYTINITHEAVSVKPHLLLIP